MMQILQMIRTILPNLPVKNVGRRCIQNIIETPLEQSLRSVMFNKKVNHTKSPPENSFSGGFLYMFENHLLCWWFKRASSVVLKRPPKIAKLMLVSRPHHHQRQEVSLLKGTKKVYHIVNGDVSITSCLRQNIGDRSFTENIEKV